jgi:hypothetical protein
MKSPLANAMLRDPLIARAILKRIPFLYQGKTYRAVTVPKADA